MVLFYIFSSSFQPHSDLLQFAFGYYNHAQFCRVWETHSHRCKIKASMLCSMYAFCTTCSDIIFDILFFGNITEDEILVGCLYH